MPETLQETPPSLSVEEYRALVLADLRALPAERVELAAARGRTLAEPVTARTAIPPFHNSSMDGYAVRRFDLRGAGARHPVTLPVVADLPAGITATPTLVPGTVARIMTGAPLPPGADAVVPLEQTDRAPERVTIFAEPEPGAFIRLAGSDLSAGDLVLAAGVTLRERHLAAAASAGQHELPVHRRPRIAVISTGSELVQPGRPLLSGQIPDSNSQLLAAAVEQAGGIALAVGIVPDDDDLLRATLTDYAGQVDAFLLSGGVSVGAYDVVKAVLAPLGVRFGPVRMQPGKPQGFGHWAGGLPIFALPGNPVSALVSFEVFVRPALRTLLGCREIDRPIIRAVAAEGWLCPPNRRQYIPVTLLSGAPNTGMTRGTATDAEGGIRVRPASRGGSGSHLVASLAAADGFAIVDESVEEIHPGDPVDVMLLES
nr:gephyrin-like molybdotransferase Glp [Leifsonia psychrotolerans]